MEETISIQIGFEVHIQLKTKSKLFCSCSAEFTSEPNVHICPVCLGYPGSLPVMNREAKEAVLLLSSALKCNIAEQSYQSRKNYFYPDLPKGYQISQYQVPIASNGKMEYWHKGKFPCCRILRVQLEEDTAKMIHISGKSLLDYNRSGIPLVEVVTAPDFYSIEEGLSFLKELRLLLRTLKISDANMEEGSMRCEPNLTVEVNGKKGAKVELKNLGSFRAVERALAYEVARQFSLLKEGKKVQRQTLGFDEKKRFTYPLRSKEFEEDYRYFYDPDLPLLSLSSPLPTLPELPVQKRKKWLHQWGLSPLMVETLSSSVEVMQFFEQCVEKFPKPKLIANWISSDLLSIIDDTGGWQNLKITPESLTGLLNLLEGGEITGKAAKEILIQLGKLGGTPEHWVEKMGVKQVDDPEYLQILVEESLKEGKDIVETYLRGKKTAATALMGLIMKKSRGRLNPQKVQEILMRKLARLEEKNK